MTLSTETLRIAAEVLGAELDGLDADQADRSDRATLLAVARAELLFELGRRDGRARIDAKLLADAVARIDAEPFGE